MDIRVGGDGQLAFGGHRFRCAIGRGGLSADKREGDGATPLGCFPLRRIFYRADRVTLPPVPLPAIPLTQADGWCDDPSHPDYNRHVRLPHPARHEAMWRDDHLYDVVVVLGHNDDPPRPGLGSAIFLHVAKPDYAPTEGCVALALPDLLTLLGRCGPNARLCVQP